MSAGAGAAGCGAGDAVRWGDFAYEDARRVVYGEGATFVPVCPNCRGFVRADKAMKFGALDGELVPGPNADCSKCGRVEMPFEGFI